MREVFFIPGLLGSGCSVLCDVVLTLCFFLLPGVDVELDTAGDDAPDLTDSAPVGEGAARADGGGGACKKIHAIRTCFLIHISIFTCGEATQVNK